MIPIRRATCPTVVLLYDCRILPEQYALLSNHPSDLWLAVVPLSPPLAQLLAESLQGQPEDFPGTALGLLNLPLDSAKFGNAIRCARISSPGRMFVHNGEPLAWEALAFIGSEIK